MTRPVRSSRRQSLRSSQGARQAKSVGDSQAMSRPSGKGRE